LSNIPLTYVIADIDFSFPQVWKKSLSYHKNYPFNRDLTKQLGFTNYVHRNKQYSFLCCQPQDSSILENMQNPNLTLNYQRKQHPDIANCRDDSSNTNSLCNDSKRDNEYHSMYSRAQKKCEIRETMLASKNELGKKTAFTHSSSQSESSCKTHHSRHCKVLHGSTEIGQYKKTTSSKPVDQQNAMHSSQSSPLIEIIELD